MICRLCELNPPINSHVIPRFVWRRLKEAGGQYRRLGTAGEADWWEVSDQREFQEPLLCSGCDNNTLGALDGYGANTTRRILNETLPRLNMKRWPVHNVDCNRFKLFGLSVLWRCSIAQGPFYKEVSLEPSVEEDLRRRILAKDAGDTFEYGVVVGRDTDDLPPFQFPPRCIQHDIFPCMHYAIVIGGLVWQIYIPGSGLPGDAELSLLRPGDTATLFLAPFGESDWFQDFVTRRQNGRVWTEKEWRAAPKS